jgi:signal transduction histidine kinase
VLSHEIRTPITSLRHALRAVGDKLGVEDRVLVEEFIGNLNRIERMLGQTLSFAKPLQLKLQTIAIADIVARAVEEVRQLPEVATMSVDVHSDRALMVKVDTQLFGEVMTNLLRNAAEACHGVGHIEVRTAREGSSAVIEVEDDGPGVPANMRDEIFKPFHSSKSYGTGIGLALCRKVVESHGGTIHLVGRPGVGACFRVELPPSVVA